MSISDLIVDPANRDIIYCVTTGLSGSAGVGHVFKSTNAGQSWTDITGGIGGLADASAWSIVLDPRTSDLYVGTDTGVYKLAGGVLNGNTNWVRFGVGLPFVQVRDISLDRSANVLTVATYGRGVFQVYLNDTQANGGAFRALSGVDVWAGPVTLTGPTTFSANGSAALPNNLTSATLEIDGVISDSTPNAVGNTLTKIGGGDLVLNGNSTYAGVTVAQQGKIRVQNPSALGSAGVPGTQVLILEDMVPNISTFQLSYHGALSFTATIPYTGDRTTDAAAIRAALNTPGFLPAGITAPPGSVTASADDTMFTIVLSFPGSPTVEPLFTVAITNSIGAGFAAQAGSTWVVTGTALQMEQSIALEPITLNGDGMQPSITGHNTGALVVDSATHTYNGTITLNSNATIGVAAGGKLVINTSPGFGIIDGGVGFAYSLTKEGDGILALAAPDTYQGNTYVNSGILTVQNSMALGASTSKTVVTDGVQLQLEAITATPLTISNTLYLSGVGTDITVAKAGALRNVAGNNIWSGDIFLSTLPDFNSATSPAGVVAIYVDPGDRLTIKGTIREGLPPTPTNGQVNSSSPSGTPPASGLAEVGLGTLALAPVAGNFYSGGTYVGYTFNQANINGSTPAGVPGGTIDVQNANALGTNLTNREIQRLVTFSPPGASNTFTLSFSNPVTGVTSTTQNLNSVRSAGAVQAALNGFPGGVAGPNASISRAINGDTAANSATINNITGVTNSNQLVVGMPVYGARLTGQVAITAASWASGIATITIDNTNGPIPFAAGQDVSITGVLPIAYNGANFTILSVNTGANSFTVALPLFTNPGPGLAFGTATDYQCYFITSVVGTTSITLNTGVGITAGAGTALTLGGVIVNRSTVYNGLSESADVDSVQPRDRSEFARGPQCQRGERPRRQSESFHGPSGQRHQRQHRRHQPDLPDRCAIGHAQRRQQQGSPLERHQCALRR